MKVVLRLVGAFLGVLFLGVLLSGFLYPDTETPEWFIMSTFLLAVIAAAVTGTAAWARAPAGSVGRADRPLFSGTLRHLSGLDLPSDIKCRLAYWPDRLTVTAMNQQFSLPHSKIRGAAKSTREQAQRYYVSSAGGALAGAALFGPVGAAIGGRTRQKVSYTRSSCLVLAYGEAGEGPKYLIFEWNNSARPFLSACRKQCKGVDTRIDL